MRRQNLEQKFSCCSVNAIIERCRAERYRFHSCGCQDDLYFAAKKGRLKIRRTGDAPELIFYLRRESKEPRVSDFFRLPLEFGQDEIALILTAALGVVGRVKKQRTVYYHRSVRINIDRVDGLGDFVELEANRRRGERGEALRLLEATRTALGLENEKAIADSYIDLISRKSPAGPTKSRGRDLSRKT